MNCPCPQCQGRLSEVSSVWDCMCEGCEGEYHRLELHETNDGWLCAACIEDNEINNKKELCKENASLT